VIHHDLLLILFNGNDTSLKRIAAGSRWLSLRNRLRGLWRTAANERDTERSAGHCDCEKYILRPLKRVRFHMRFPLIRALILTKSVYPCQQTRIQGKISSPKFAQGRGIYDVRHLARSQSLVLTLGFANLQEGEQYLLVTLVRKLV